MRATNRNMLLNVIFWLGITSTVVVAQQDGPGPGKGGYKPSEIVCRLDSTTTIDEINSLFETTTRGHQAPTDCFLLYITGGRNVDSLAAIISQTPGVVYCIPNYYLIAPEGLQGSSAFPDLERTGDMATQLAATELQLSETSLVATGTDVKVAIIDGGVNLTHPYFAEQPGDLVPVWDYVDSDSVPVDEPGGSISGHGTFVAGITRLVAPDADLLIYRVLDTAGFGDGFAISSAVLRAIDDGCRVINLSLGMTGMHDGLDDALKFARQCDVLVVAAAGNDSTDAPSEFPFPASRDYCLAVAALDSTLLKADFSNYGAPVDVCAPGTRVYAPYLDSDYAWWDGTSFSTPFVTGLAALLCERYPVASWGDLYTALRSSARDVDPLNPTFAGLLGTGQIHPLSALGVSFGFMRGDLNSDSTITLGDVMVLAAYLFVFEDLPNPGLVADCNCDGQLSLGDLMAMVSFLFIDGQPLCPVP
jgi:hypothetical protein